MSATENTCVICGGGPTVKSHLFPRALIFDIRRDAKSVIVGSRHPDGVRFSQSGEWDPNILCKVHEDIIGAGDDYAIDFCRSVKQAIGTSRTETMRMPNPHPDRLVHFCYATVWRHAISSRSAGERLSLGPYETMIRMALLKKGPYGLPVVISLSPMTIGGHGRIEFAVNPYRQKLLDRNTWHFLVGGLDVHVITDKRSLAKGWAPLLANGNDPIVLTSADPMDVRDVPLLRPIFDRMSARRHAKRPE